MAKYTHKNEFYTNQKPNRIEKFSYKKKNRMGKVALQSIKNRHTITMCGETEASRKEDSFFLGGVVKKPGGWHPCTTNGSREQETTPTSPRQPYKIMCKS